MSKTQQRTLDFTDPPPARLVVVQYVFDLGFKLRRSHGGKRLWLRVESEAPAPSKQLTAAEQEFVSEMLAAYEPALYKACQFCKTTDEREELLGHLRAHVSAKIKQYRPVEGKTFGTWLGWVVNRSKIDFYRKWNRRAQCLSIEDEIAGCVVSVSEPQVLTVAFVSRAFNREERAVLDVLTGGANVRSCGLSPAEYKIMRSRVREFLKHHLAGVFVGMPQMLFDLVPAPSADSINSGLSPGSARLLSLFLGDPRQKMLKECAYVTNDALRARIVTHDFGHFKATGEKLAVESLKVVMADIEKESPDVYREIGTEGMLCARLIRGSSVTPSNHSWGTAIDLTIAGKLDVRGDKKVQRGLLAIYKFFHRHGWWWGAEFNTEDAMHFELSSEKIKELYSNLRNSVAIA